MEQRNNQNNGIGNGFVLGFVLGVIVTLLFSTKKGREVLKVLTDKGIQKFSHLDTTIQEIEDEFEDGDDFIEDVEKPSIVGEGVEKGGEAESEVEKPQPKPHTNGTKVSKASLGRRFFSRKKS